MRHVRMVSRVFPSHHPKKGQSTHFVEKILDSVQYGWFLNYYEWLVKNNPNIPSDDISSFVKTIQAIETQPKHHTVRAGKHLKVGDTVSLRVWSDKPYRSKQIIIAPDQEIKKLWDIEIKKVPLRSNKSKGMYVVFIDGKAQTNEKEFMKLVANDGLSFEDFCDWFELNNEKKEIHFEGQIICWNDSIDYEIQPAAKAPEDGEEKTEAVKTLLN